MPEDEEVHVVDDDPTSAWPSVRRAEKVFGARPSEYRGGRAKQSAGDADGAEPMQV